MAYWNFVRHLGFCLLVMDAAFASLETERPNGQQDDDFASLGAERPNGQQDDVLGSLGTERPNGQQDDVLALLINKVDGMQAKLDRLEMSENAMKQRITELENKLEKYEQMDVKIKPEDEDVANVPEEERRNSDVESNGVEMSIQKKPQVRITPVQNTEQAAFTAYLDHMIRNHGKDQPVVYNRVLLNDGNGYNNNTGIFRVPTTGVYLFSWSVTAKKLPNEQSYDVWVNLLINGNHQVGAVADSRSDYEDIQGSNSVVLRCNQGDEVWTSHYNDGYPVMFGDDNERTTSFMGVLLFLTE